MSWLLIATRTWWGAGIALIGGMLAGLLRGDTAPVPSLTQGTLTPVPALAVIALAPAFIVLWCWSGLPWSSTACSARPSFLVLAPAMLTCHVVFILSSGVLGGVGAALESGRNAAGLTGLALLGGRFFGDRGGALVPICYLLAAFLAGRPAASTTAYPWAWILDDAGNALALAIAVTVALFGLCTLPGLPASSIRSGQG